MIEEGYDALLIESMEEEVNEESTVCVTNYDVGTGGWLSGLNYITSMKHALEEGLKEGRKIVAKDENVKKFLEVYFDKQGD